MGLNRNLSKVPEVLTVSGSYVGIGTTNPDEIFHVNSGAGNVPALFESTDPIAVVQFKDNNSTGFNAVGGQTNDLLFYSNNNINMRINSSGHGMFTNSIAVGGAAVGLSGINMPNQNYLAWYLSGGTGAQNVAIRGNGENLELSSGGGLTMTMDSSQRVGIGVSSPVTKLHLQDSSPTYVLLTNTAADGVPNAIQGGIIGQSRGYGNNLAQMSSILFRNKNAADWYKGEITFNTNGSDGTDPGIAPTERMRIDSTGNIVMGMSGNNTGLILRQATSVNRFELFVGSGGGTYIADDNYIRSYNTTLHFLAGSTGTTEVMKITTDGDIVMSQARSISIDLNSTPAGGSAKYWRINNNSANGTFRIQQITNGGGMYLDPGNPNGGWFGISDMRQKNDLGLIEDGALEKVMNLKARRFTFKTQEENALPSVGFFAQEILQHLPETVTKIQEEEGEVLTYNANFVIPYLVKAIQELTERIKILENK
jgi:hypothetical protein